MVNVVPAKEGIAPPLARPEERQQRDDGEAFAPAQIFEDLEGTGRRVEAGIEAVTPAALGGGVGRDLLGMRIHDEDEGGAMGPRQSARGDDVTLREPPRLAQLR